MRSAATVELGERLCAFRLHRTPEGVGRERICGRVIERQPAVKRRRAPVPSWS